MLLRTLPNPLLIEQNYIITHKSTIGLSTILYSHHSEVLPVLCIDESKHSTNTFLKKKKQKKTQRNDTIVSGDGPGEKNTAKQPVLKTRPAITRILNMQKSHLVS